MKYYLAVDIGGTQIRVARYLHNSTTPQQVERTPTKSTKDTPLSRLIKAIHSIWPQNGEVIAIGLAAPGPVNPYKGIIIEAPNIPGWDDMPLQQHIEEAFHVPVALGNDANLAALGEWKFGAGKGHHHIIYMTVSTGIGGGVIMNDQLVLGCRGLAAELGHVVVLPNGPPCGCGGHGHLEALASGPSLARWVSEQIKAGARSILPGDCTLSGKDVALAAQRGDSLANAALRRAGQFLGWALADYLHIFNPSIIIIGGGVSQSGDLLFGPLKTAIHERVINKQYTQDLSIIPAALGDDVGLMGALALAMETSP